MTTESAPAPHSARATAARRPAPLVHAPRRTAARRPPVRAHRHPARRERPTALLLADATAAVVTLALAPALLWPTAPWPAVSAVPLVLVQGVLHTWRGLYRRRLSPSALAELPVLLGLAMLQWYALTATFAAQDPPYEIALTAPALAGGGQALLACAGRAAVHHARRRSAARRPRSTLVVGRGPVAQQVTAALYEHPEYGLRPVGQVDPAGLGGPVHAALPVLAGPEDVSRAVIQNAVGHAVFTRPPGTGPESAALLRLFARHGCRVWLVDGTPAEPGRQRRAPGRDHLWGFPVRPLDAARRPFSLTGKRVMDVCLAAVALVAAAPVLVVCALAVRLFDGPGIIFRQERIGLDGRPFVLLKFRTISPVDEHESATRWSVASDRRMSVTGSLLRRTSLDELPQLWNVLRGDMSLVGPRPERPYFVAKFSRVHPGYQARHRMPVGITGLAQIHGLRGDTSIEERARFDNHYIDTWSLWQDVCILVRTAASMLRLGGS
ncbi:exopolysaccharide biosynthesis polyprenyl glycosylphosphotransferase [Streptomyces sp. Tu 2975]|uniref:exopolysaccharide biosynthesis polyprenyl glycosylphosphotransferase n=1 Tax=Streptomyces sp. Tu 2975 TaxID=2676871 RepID=UPI00135B3934|nr:exopolysaccharide biosynthesis polyprenyl glycosylphosphotransferase [Streptomyces sp. Tu 2975]QIP84916.1 exopolysaccharide biosynthesis polyprenyl glycosylphosphotransferase [Streptomyces sp. Tu 2975]